MLTAKSAVIGDKKFGHDGGHVLGRCSLLADSFKMARTCQLAS